MNVLILGSGGRVKAIVVSNCAKYSRKTIDELTNFVKQYHNAKGLAWMKAVNGNLEGGISKFFPNDVRKDIIENCSVNDEDIVFIVGDEAKIVFSLQILPRSEKSLFLISKKALAGFFIICIPSSLSMIPNFLIACDGTPSEDTSNHCFKSSSISSNDLHFISILDFKFIVE